MIKMNYDCLQDKPAEFILLVEKDAAFQRLAEDKYRPCPDSWTINLTINLSAATKKRSGPKPDFAERNFSQGTHL